MFLWLFFQQVCLFDIIKYLYSFKLIYLARLAWSIFSLGKEEGATFVGMKNFIIIFVRFFYY